MTAWITETSNFILIAALAIYVSAAYLTMWTRRFETGLTRMMAICRYLIHGYGFFVLFLKTFQYTLIPFYLLQLAFFLMADIMQKRIFKYHIEMLYQNMMLLLSIGLVILTRLSMSHAVKHFVFAALAFSICMIIPFVLRCIKKLEDLRWLYTALGLGLLLVVLIMGSSFFGAKNWLTIQNVTFQPSEFVKLLFVLAMAALLVRKTENKYKNLLLVSVVAALHVGMLALSNDFGGALIFFAVYLLMLFVVSADLLFPIAACLTGGAAAVFAYQYSGHIRERVLAWKDPFSCIKDEGYQIAQSLFAIGSGDWFGTGLYDGMPKTVPVVKSDFIFSAIAEELGIIFAALVLCVYINCIIWMLLLALERKEPFYFAVSTGAAALFGVQVFLNVGGVIKLIPSTGVTLSFISYGGSSLISTMILFQGIQGMCAIERGRTAEQEEEEAETGRKRRTRKTKEEKRLLALQKGQQFRMTLVCSGILLLLCITTAYFVGVTGPLARGSYENEYNQRIRARENAMLKGKILSSDGKILAQSIAGEDGNIYRVYPYGEKAAFLTGRNTMGKTGLEASKNQVLYETEADFFESLLQEISGEPAEGNTLVTTIDMGLQTRAYEVLSGYTGAVAVMEVKSGRLLALASTPSYDPNEVEASWEELTKRTDAPLYNRVLNGLYPPGSIFKTVTVLAYLKEHSVDEFACVCAGTARVQNTTVNCYDGKAHGEQTLHEAFANSCNVAFALMGQEISDAAYREVADQLGFGVVWESELSYTADKFSVGETTPDAVRVQAAFGQGETLMTPYHALLLTAAVANGGVLQMPYLTEQILTCDGELVEDFSSPEAKRLMSEAESDLLTEYMVAASESKMEELLAAGITVAGKTGSAEYSEDMPAHSWYICFAPAEDPQIAICVLMESVGTGSKYALPAARELLKEYFGVE